MAINPLIIPASQSDESADYTEPVNYPVQFSGINPLITPQSEEPDNIGPIDYPVKRTATESAYHLSSDIEPDRAAQVIKTAKSLNEDPQFVDSHLEDAKQAAQVPPSQYFANLEKNYPKATRFLSDPTNMAVAKDDIPNITNTEKLVQDYGLGQTLFNSTVAGFAKINQQLAGIPNVVQSYANLIPNLALRAAGKPQLNSDFPGSSEAMNYWSDMAKSYTPPINDQSVSDVLKTGNVSQISKVLASKLVEGAPSLAMLIAANAITPGAGIAAAGLTSASEVLERNKQLGIDPADAAINSAYHGSINAAFMNLGALSPLHKWESAIAGSIGKDSARQVVLDMAKTISGSLASMGGSMAAMVYGTGAVDAMTGVNPNAMEGINKRALDAGIEGGITGAAMVGPAAILGGIARSGEVQRAEQAKNFYLALGDTMKDSKLRQRLPEEHQQLIENLTKDGPISDVYIPAADYDTYWQSKKMDPDQVSRDLGVFNQLAAAREAGGDIAIPLSTWADKVVGTEHYNGLADDIKFRPEDLTTRQVNEQKETVGKLVQGEADKAVQENPALQEGRDFVYTDLKKQLTETGQLDPAKIDAQAQLGASMITQMAAQRGIDPKEFYQKGAPLDVKSATGPAAGDSLRQGSISDQELDKAFGNIVDEVATGKRMPRTAIPTGRTSEVLKFIGAKDLPVTMSAEVIGKAREKHQISIDDIKRVPEELRDPMMVFNSTSQPNAIVALTEIKNAAGKPVVAAIHLERSEGRYSVNKIATLTERDHAAIAKDIKNGQLRYWDEKRATPWLQSAGLSATTGEGIKASGSNIRSKEDFVKAQNQNQTSGKLFQGDPETDPRGFIQFTPKETVIGLVKADASTFPHELAHYWLKNFHDFVQSGQAQDNHLKDWKVLSDWLGVKDDQKTLERDQQEQFARGFESYLREGKAPSEGLRGVFAKFRKWLTRLYKDPITLGVELNDNVRGVMSRMLASEDEIAFAERNMGIDLGKEYEGLDPKVASKLVALREQAHEEAVTQLMTEQMKELEDSHKKMLLDESVKARTAAEDRVRNSDIQEAMRIVGSTFGSEPRELAQNYWTDKMGDEGRQSFDLIAEVRGYSSGDELAKKIIDEEPVEKQVQALVDQHMEQFASLRTRREQIQAEALKAVHNEKSTELMAREHAIFQGLVDEAKGKVIDQKRRAAEAKIQAEAAKTKAKEVIAAKPVAAAGQYLPYFTAERNEALKVQKALLAKDYQAAAEAKQRQLLNHALAGEAFKARAEIDKTLRFFDRFASRGQDLKDIPYGFIRQIDTLLSDRGLAEPRTEDAKTYLKIAQDMAKQGEDPDAIAHATGYVQDGNGGYKPEALADTVARIQNDYRDVFIPPSVLTARPVAYKGMTLADFRDLKTAVKAINAIGRGYDNFLDETIKMDRKEAAARFRQQVESDIGKPRYEERLPGSKPGETIIDKTVDVFNNARGILTPSLVNLYSFCHFLSNGDKDGLAMNLIYRPLEHALNNKLRMNAEEITEMKGILEKHWPDAKAYAKFKQEKVYIKSLDRDYTRDQIQAFFNNWGTDTGRDRVTNMLDGAKLTEEQTKEILSNVTKEQADFAQAIWDHNDKYWPQIVAQQQKVSGETPERVSPAKVEMPFGTYRGGYYPLSYDRAKSSEAVQNVDARDALYKTQGATAAHTSHGFTNARVQNYGQPVNLDTKIEFTHLENVIHDLSHRQAIIDVAAFLRQRDTREAIINAVGREGYDTIMGHVKWVGSDQGEMLNGVKDRTLQRLRFNATTASLGLRPATAPIFFFSNAINAVKDLGMLGFGNAMKDFIANKDENVAFVDRKSPSMKNRATLMDRTLTEMDESHQGNAKLMAHLLFYPHQKADQAITYPVWLHTYKENLAEHGEQKAIDLANEAVSTLAGDGSVLGQAMAQRGSEWQKAWYAWYSWSGNQFNRLWRDGKMAGLAYDRGNIGTALTILGNSAFYGVGLLAANDSLWKDIIFHNGQNQEDDDKRNSRMLMRIPRQAASYIGGPVGVLLQYGIDKMGGGQKGMELPVLQSLESATDPLWQWARDSYTGKDTPRFWENTSKAAAMIAPYPQYINTLAWNFIDSMNGEDLSWRDLFTRRTKT